MFSDEVKYQLDFAKKSFIFNIFGNHHSELIQKRILEADNFLKNTDIDKITLLNSQETFENYEDIKKYQSIIKKYTDKEILISAPTSTPIDNFYNPLVNIFFWKDVRMRADITWNFDKKSFKLFNKDLYKESDKSIKGILSMRRERNRRNYLFSRIDKSNFEGILRYGKWVNAEDETKEYINDNKDKFPIFKQLIDEYKKSYVSFIVETELSDFMNPFTEKTIMAFLTKTMPIVLGGKNYVKELKEMGFYVWNDEFGFENADKYEYFDITKIDSFHQCIKNYNQMNKNEIINMYNSNLDKIENNYKIVKEILFYNQNLI